MKCKKFLYIDWINRDVFPRLKKYGADLFTLEGRRLAHIRSSKNYSVKWVEGSEIYVGKYKWWVDSELVGGRGVYDVVTRKKINAGKTDTVQEAIDQVAIVLEFFGYKRIPDALINLL